MKYRKPLSSILLSAFLLLTANSTTSASSDSEKATDSLPSIIGTEIINGLMEVEKQTTRTRVGLTVNLLGSSDLVDWELQRNNVQTATMTLSNNYLGVESEINAAIESVSDPEKQLILKEAFEYLKEDEGDSGGMYNTYWRPSLPPDESDDDVITPSSDAIGQYTTKDLFDTGLTGGEYFGLLRDRNVARNLLLRRHKLQYQLSLKPQGIEASPFEDDIFTATPQEVKWEIKVYRAVQSSKPDIVFYRFAIRAVTEPHEFLIPASYWRGGEDPEISAAVYLVSEGEQKISLNAPDGFDIDRMPALTVPQNTGADTRVETVRTGFQNTLERITADNPPNRFGNVFSFFGEEGEVAKLLGRALTQSPIEGNSIISGGLIGFSNESSPEALVGVNQRFASFGSFDAGLLFGATPETDTSIFIGPSLRYSLLTLGVGARLAGEDSLEVDAAGVVSIDISQLLADDDDNLKSLVIGDPRKGGSVGQLANIIAQNQMLAVVSLTTPPELGDSIAIDFTRTHIDIGCITTESEESALDDAQFIVEQEKKHFRFLPQGCYRGKLNTAALNSLDSYELRLNGGNPLDISADGTFDYPVTRDGLQEIDLVFLRK